MDGKLPATPAPSAASGSAAPAPIKFAGFKAGAVYLASVSGASNSDDFLKSRGAERLARGSGFTASQRSLELSSYALTDPAGWNRLYLQERARVFEDAKARYEELYQKARDLMLLPEEAEGFASEAAKPYLEAQLRLVDQALNPRNKAAVEATAANVLTHAADAVKPPAVP